MDKLKIKENLINRERKNKENLEKRREEIFSQLNNILPKIHKDKSISKIIIHGSILDNNFNTYSDLDIYIENVPAENYWEILRLLNRNIDIEVDLVTQDDDADLIKMIKKTGKTLYERES